MPSKRLLATSAVAALAVAAIPLSFAGPTTLRLAVIGLFLLTGPGAALVLLLRMNRPSTRMSNQLVPLLGSIAIGFSLAISAILSTIMLYAHLWHPSAAVAGLSVLTLGLLALGMKRSSRPWATQ